MRLIAVERGLRTIVLVAVGIVLLVDAHADWGHTIADAARHLGLDPSSNGIQKLITKVRAVSPRRVQLFGAVAIGYGALEGAEAYGLWNRRRWGEYLTVIATSLLLIPEVYEIAKRATVLKIGGFLVNLAIVAYLIRRLRRESQPSGPAPRPGSRLPEPGPSADPGDRIGASSPEATRRAPHR